MSKITAAEFVSSTNNDVVIEVDPDDIGNGDIIFKVGGVVVSPGGGGGLPDEWTVDEFGGLTITVENTVADQGPAFAVDVTQYGEVFSVDVVGTPKFTLHDSTFDIYVDDVDFGFYPFQADSESIIFNLSTHYSTIFEIRAEGSNTKPSLRAGYNHPDEIILGYEAGKVGFYGTTGINKQTGVAVTAGGIHAALVALGLFAA